MIGRLIRERNKTGNMIFFTSSASLFGNVLTLISGLLVAKWMLPEDLGFFNSFSILTSYIILIQLGIPSGLSRELPFQMGKGDQKNVEELAAAAQFWGLLLGILVLLGSIIAGVFFLIQGKLELAAGSVVVGVTSFQALYVTKYLQILFRSNAAFNKLAVINTATSVMAFIGVGFVWKFGFYGLCLRALLVTFVDFGLTFFWRPLKVNPVWSYRRFVELFKSGMPIYSVASIYGLWPVFERTVVLLLGGTKSLGLYALATIVDGTLKTVQTSISSICFPKMSYAFGQGAGFRELMLIPLKFVGINLGLNAIVLVAGWLLLPFIVSWLLPNYIAGVEAAQWMLVVSLVSILSIFSNVYMVIKKNIDRLKAYLIGMLVWAILLYYFHFSGIFDLTIFPKALIAGYAAMLLTDAFFYRRYYLLSLQKA